jgi:hypothetical protein
MKYGARHLKRAIERHIVYPLANLLATEQVRLGDVLCIDWDEARQALLFEREGEGAVLPVPVSPAVAANAQAAGAGGRAAEQPSIAAAREIPTSVSIPLAPVPAPAGRRKNDS